MITAMVQIVDFFMLQRYELYAHEEVFKLIISVNFNVIN